MFAYRFWALFAIPASLLAAESKYECLVSLKKPFRQTFLFLVVVAITWTSAYPKFITNTYLWSPGYFWSSMNEVRGYLWLRYSLKPNTKVFALTDNKFVIGNDMQSDYWSATYQKSFQDAIAFEPEGLSEALRANNFEYLIIGEREIKKFGRGVIQDNIEKLKRSEKFELAFEIQRSIWIFKVL